MLLTGDIELVSEWLLSREGERLESDVMLVPHHGSDTSSITRFLEAVSPQVAIASLAKGNQWGYCVQACPYDARFINEDTLTADKCTFCAHRLEQGLLPACVETCVGGARVIGDLNDPTSEIRRLITEHQDDIKVLKPNEGTKPHVFYIGMDERFTSHIDGQPAIYDPQGDRA